MTAGDAAILTPAMLELADRLQREMQRDGVTVAEGFCCRCQSRLTTDAYGPWCRSCDLYPHVRFDGDVCVAVGNTTGWFHRQSPPPVAAVPVHQQED